jgi:hypothetical protein
VPIAADAWRGQCRLIDHPVGRRQRSGSLSGGESDPRSRQPCDSCDWNSWSPETRDGSVHTGMIGIAGRFARLATPPPTRIMNSGRRI